MLLSNVGVGQTFTLASGYFDVNASPVSFNCGRVVFNYNTGNSSTSSVNLEVFSIDASNNSNSLGSNDGLPPNFPSTVTYPAPTYLGVLKFYAEFRDASNGDLLFTSSIFTVEIRSIPSRPTITSNSPICEGSNLIFSTANVTGGTFSWSGVNGFSSSVQNPTITSATTAASGSYSATVTVNGCTSPSSVVITTVNQLPTAPVANSISLDYNGLQQSTSDLIPVSGQSILWFSASTGGLSSTKPQGTNVGTYNSYANAIINTTGCISSTRTLVFLTINKKPINITVDAGQTKVYGTVDPTTYTYLVSPSLTTSMAALNGTLTRASGEIVGSYAIQQNDLTTANNPNYTITYVGNNFSITAKPITITADAGQTKVYGAANPATYAYGVSPSLTGLAPLIGTLTRATGEIVGSYAIQQNDLTTANNPNYTITYVGNNFSITAKPITITADAGQTKVYGAVDPTSYIYGVSPSLTGLAPLIGTLTRAAGETVGPYAIQQGTLTNANNPNYTITYLGNNFTITKKTLTITVDAGQTKVYGAVDPATYTYVVSPSITIGLAPLNGTLTRVSGEIVGSYAIQQNDLTTSNNPNYTITYVGNNFSITAKPITITADAGQTKVYGAVDPTTYTYGVSPSLTGLATLNGTLTRVAGETVGSYVIQQNDLTTANNPNYTITYVGNNFTITKKPITITADAGQTKVYGALDPTTYTYGVSPSLTGLAPLNGTLTRATGETVGSYAIQQNDLTTANNPNYTITYVGNNFSITAKPITITADAGQTKVYGAANPATYTFVVSPSLTGLAPLNGTLTRASGETVGSYVIQQNDLTTANNPNYTISYVGNNFSITAKPITITVDAGQSKVYGAADPVTYTYGVSPSLTGLATLNGTLTRASGETVGSYAIQQNDLTTANNPNYTISYVGNDFTITKKTLTITATPGQTKVYGAADPTSYAYTLSAPLLGSDVLTGALTRVAGETVGPYAIQQGTLTNPNYDITYVGNNFTITPAALSIKGITGANKIYDGTTNATINGTASYVGLISADAGLAVAGTPSFNFNNKNKGIAKQITVTGFTAPSLNYILTQPTGLTGDITPKTVIINAVANDKQYDGNTTATLNNITSPGFISGDLVTVNYTSATFDTKEVGNNKTVTVTGISLTSTDAPNYVLASNTATALANITAPPVFIFEIPNAFTPNGDGLNDILKIIGNSGVKELKGFKIYSRSGNLVFETRDLSVGWDGRFKGNMLPSDIYYWTAVYVDRNDQTNSKTGTVLLLK
jgi:gliding motility-associated-like protein